jgi:hypothetical protein
MSSEVADGYTGRKVLNRNSLWSNMNSFLVTFNDPLLLALPKRAQGLKITQPKNA